MNLSNEENNNIPKEGIITIEGFSDSNANELSSIIKKFINSYLTKNPDISDKEWLKSEFKKELPDLNNEELEKLSNECFVEIHNFDNNLKSLNEAIESGSTRESWFSKKVQEASIGMSINEYGNYLKTIDDAINNANAQMQRVVTNMNGNINQNINLDGFIAEQYHVNTFNMNAKLNESNFRAEVLVPRAGETYGKNSFDVVIRDNNSNIVHQYQLKYGATAKDTINLIKNGNYNNQRIVVPPEQVEEVRRSFPTKSIESSIGGTDKVKISSKALSKEKAKEIQLATQKEGNVLKENWNHFKTKDIARGIAKNAGVAGIQAAIITTGFDMARRVTTGEKLEASEAIELALKTGSDAGIKAAATGALKVGIEKGIVTAIPKGTPIGVLTNIVCVGIENIKILSKVTSGELTMSEALDRMGRVTTAMVYGISWGATASLVGAAALAWIPIIGPILGGFIGGMIGYMAGSKFGETIYNAGKKVVSTAKKVISKAWNGIKSTSKKVFEKIFE